MSLNTFPLSTIAVFSVINMFWLAAICGKLSRIIDRNEDKLDELKIDG